MMKNSLLAAPLALLLTACVSPQALDIRGPSAKLAINHSSDSVGTTTMTWRVFYFESAACAEGDKGTMVARKLLGDGTNALETVTLPAGQPATLAFGYVEARFAQNRECSYAMTFTPAEQASYTAHFAVIGASSACAVVLTDAAGKVVPFDKPPTSCFANLQGKRSANGQGSILDYKIKVNVTTVPAK